MTMTRKCRFCGTEYQYENFPNVITFCPKCRKQDLLMCEYGYGPVAPCRIYLGKELIGLVTYDDKDHTRYRFDSMKYNIHRVLKSTYMDALEEAAGIAAGHICPEYDGKERNSGAGTGNDRDIEATAPGRSRAGEHKTARAAKTGQRNSEKYPRYGETKAGAFFLALVCLAILIRVITPPSGSAALANDIAGVMIMVFMWLYLLVRIRHNGKPKAKAVKIAVMTIFAAVILWLSAMPVCDMISGPKEAVLYQTRTERTQGHTGLFSRHYYLCGRTASGETIRVEISADDYSGFEDDAGSPGRSIYIEYYGHTKKLIRSSML